MRRTKIIATLGPAVSSFEKICELVEAGMNVVRINTAHGDWDTRRQWISWVREAETRYGTPLAILLDLAGPKVRIGRLPGPLTLQKGQVVRFVLHEACDAATPAAIPLPVPEIFRAAQPNDRLLVDDGSIELSLTQVEAEQFEAVVLEGGELSSQRGITLPNRTLALPSMTPKDREDLKQGLDAGVDWVALSFVRSVSDVLNLQALIKEYGADTPVIAKIEQRAALEELEAIIEVSDGVMVARGDLGVQVDLAEVPALQKQIIRLCNAHAKPVITATQMLESMVREGRPTRAEVTDVANAVLDGSDALMLSGETAVGAYPAQAVRWMARIAENAEEALFQSNGLIPLSRRKFSLGYPDGSEKISGSPLVRENLISLSGSPLTRGNLKEGDQETAGYHSTTEAVARAACLVAQMVGAKAILTPTTSGGTPRWVSHFRPAQPILALTPKERIWRRLALLWGVAPLRIPHVSSTDEMTAQALLAARQTHLVHQGDRVVLTAGVPVGVPGNTNMIQVLTIDLPDSPNGSERL